MDESRAVALGRLKDANDALLMLDWLLHLAHRGIFGRDERGRVAIYEDELRGFLAGVKAEREAAVEGESVSETDRCAGVQAPEPIEASTPERLTAALNVFRPGVITTCDVGQCQECGGYTLSKMKRYCTDCAFAIIEAAVGTPR